MEINEALDKYEEKFGGFPSMCFMGVSDEAIIKVIEKSLKEGKPVEIKKDVLY